MARVVAQHGLDDAQDIAAVLRYRVDKLAASPPRGCQLRPQLIAGLIAEPLGAMSVEDRVAIDLRTEIIESRARTLAAAAVAGHEAWTKRLGPIPDELAARERWLDAASTVAAYRDRYNVASDVPVGGGARNEAQRADRDRALAALRSAASANPAGRPAVVRSVEVHAVSTP